MAEQRWKTDEKLFNAPTEQNGEQTNKKLDYDTTYRSEFLDADPIKDWDSIERCKWLWGWAIEMLVDKTPTEWTVLDVGTKDAQFPDWLREQSIAGMGIEYSEPYVRYAIEKGRPVTYGNACAMEFPDNSFDFVFSHHIHGLLPDYMVGLQEMFRVSSKYMIALNQIPGNRRKHFSYIDSPQIYHDFVGSCDCEVIYNDFLETGFGNEWVVFLKKNQPEGYKEGEKYDFKVSVKEEEPYDVILEPEFRSKKENPYNEG